MGANIYTVAYDDKPSQKVPDLTEITRQYHLKKDKQAKQQKKRLDYIHSYDYFKKIVWDKLVSSYDLKEFVELAKEGRNAMNALPDFKFTEHRVEGIYVWGSRPSLKKFILKICEEINLTMKFPYPLVRGHYILSNEPTIMWSWRQHDMDKFHALRAQNIKELSEEVPNVVTAVVIK